MPQNQVFWYLTPPSKTKQLTNDINVDVVVIGGGMAGISAAQSFRKKGCSVALIEKYFCGAGATGKSSGFITPDSELDLSYLSRVYGRQHADKLWQFAMGGVKLIERNSKEFNLECDYQPQNILMVTNRSAEFASIREEHMIRTELGYKSTLYQQEELPTVLGSPHYYGGLSYGDSFGIRAYKYVQGMKEVLLHMGVSVYEETPALRITGTTVETPHAIMHAKYIIVCIDRWLPELGKLTQDIYQAQTFLMVSTPLTDAQINQIFPAEPYMVWDTDLIYQYFRIVDNNRLLIGGCDLLHTFSSYEQYNAVGVYHKLERYLRYKFPTIELSFSYRWPGLIGISKDSMPCAGRDPSSPTIYYISAAMGLPWAAALGMYSADSIIDNKTDFDTYFSPTRSFPLGHGIQKIIGKRATFALSNGITMFIKPLWHRP